jgi:hypothetical protein
VAAAHPTGTPIYLLTKAEGMCCWPDSTGVWDPNGTLIDEIGANLARVYDEAGFSQIYFDGNECQARPFGVGAMAEAFWRHVKVSTPAFLLSYETRWFTRPGSGHA